MRRDRDLAALGALAALAAAQFVPEFVNGLTPFWGDLTYLHHPWRAFDAQVLQAGRLPLWNPYLYFGMPAAAAMQDEAFYPGGAAFVVLGFRAALLLFQAAHCFLPAAFFYLWLRALRLRRSAAAPAALICALGGVWLRDRPFLNHAAVLAFFPAFLLFGRRPRLLAPAMACAFLAGYPPFFAGAAAAAFALPLFLGRRPERGRPASSAAEWLSAGTWGAALAACLLLPGLELARLSRRASGVGLEEALLHGLSPRDLAQWLSPLLAQKFDPGGEWWKPCFIGFFAAAAAGLGLAALPRRRAGALAAWLAAVVMLMLGGSNPVSRAAWAHLPALRYVRYPGFLSYLALPVLVLLAGAGLHKLPVKAARVLGLLIAAELSFYGWSAFPAAPSGLFTSRGPLAARLQRELEGHRYLLSPRALEYGRGAGYEDWKQRLYGLGNAPYRLRAAGNVGEPLVPQANYAFMDRLYRASGAEAAARLFPWADIRFLLTPGVVPAATLLVDDGAALWHFYRSAVPPAPAYFLSEKDGERLPSGLPDRDLPAPGRPLSLERPREDRFALSARTDEPGWVYVSEPRYPGWRVRLETPRGEGAVESLPALSAFQRVHVPQGPWRLEFRFESGSWRWGAAVTVLALTLLCAAAWRSALGWSP